MAPESDDQAELRRAAADLEEARSTLAAIGVVLSAAAFAIADALKAESRRLKRERAAARQQARKAA